MSRLAPVGAALFAAFAVWLSQGTIGLAGADGARIALLPVSVRAFAGCAATAAVVLALWRAGASLLPVSLFGLLILPWLPFGVPSAFLIWTRPMGAIVAVAATAAMTATLPISPVRVHLRNPRLVAAVAAGVLFALSAWRAAPMVPGGDEPHYLIITQSLLLDGDLTIEDVHRRGDYRAYFPGELRPDVQRRGRNGEIYSIHAPGLPVVVAPAYAIGGYRAVVFFLIVIAAAGSALAWHVAWMATGRAGAAWFGWAAVTLPVTAVFQSFTIYPDGPGAVLALTGLWALLRADRESKDGATRALPWFLHGAALALLPWFHSRFAVLAGGMGALVLLRLSTTRNPAAKAVAFLAVPAVSAMFWVGFFVAIYGTPDPSAPYAPGGGSFAFVPGGLGGLLFDQRFGLLTYAPVLMFAFAGLGMMVARPAWRRVALEILFVLVPYLLTVSHFAMWWGGWSAPARFFAPVLPLMAVPAAAAWTLIRNRVGRALAAAALILTAIATTILVVVDRGRLAFNTRDAPSLWLEWVGRAVDLTAAAPMWARETDLPLFRAIFVWLAIGAAGVILLKTAEASGHLRGRGALAAATGGILAAVVMAASSMLWAFDGHRGASGTASQLELLDAVAAGPRSLGLLLDDRARIAPADVPPRLQIEMVRRPGRRPSGRDTPPLFALPPLPAGEFRLSVASNGAGGWVMAGIARDPRDPFALRTLQLPFEPVVLPFRVPVRGLVLRGDEDAWRTVHTLVLEPLRILGPSERLSDEVARRAVRYGDSTVFFLDDRSFPEPEAFWVGGGRSSTVVIQPDRLQPHASVRLRNAPVSNQVTIEAAGWRRELELPPGEEQQIEVPIDPARGGVRLRLESRAGFRPAEQDPASRDQRYLGVWVKVE